MAVSVLAEPLEYLGFTLSRRAHSRHGFPLGVVGGTLTQVLNVECKRLVITISVHGAHGLVYVENRPGVGIVDKDCIVHVIKDCMMLFFARLEQGFGLLSLTPSFIKSRDHCIK
jgi:hypothetical protein